MPYVPIDYTTRWDEKGNPYWQKADGTRMYIPPITATDGANSPNADQRLVAWGRAHGSTPDNPGGGVPQSSFSKGPGTWNDATGQYDRGSFWNTSLGGLILGGGAMAAGPVAGAIAGGGGVTAPAAASTVGSAAPEIGVTTAEGLGGFVPTTAGGIGAGSYGAAAPAAAAGGGGSFLPSFAKAAVTGKAGGGAAGLSAGDYAGVGVNAAGSLLSSYYGAKNANEQAGLDRQTRLDLQHNDLAASTARDTQSLAGRESELDPFRNQMSQAKDIGQLDRLERASYAPVKLGMPSGSPYAKYMPQTSGGYSYEKSPELMASASALKKNVMGGNTAPSMTNPDNYGKTGAMDILGVMAGKKDPTSSSSFSTGTPAPGSSLGADPVAGMIRNGYQSALGRPASDEDIRSTIGQLSRTYGRQITAADSGLVQDWIQRNLRTSPEAQARQSSGGYTPSYMNAA